MNKYKLKCYELPKQTPNPLRTLAFCIDPDGNYCSADIYVLLKNFVYITLLFSLPLCGQNSNDPDLSKELLNEFIEQGLRNDFYAAYHIENHLKGVYFLPSNEFKTYLNRAEEKAGCVGLRPNYEYAYYENIILINNRYTGENLKAILAHELGHFFGLGHDEENFPNVMNPILSEEFKMTDEDYFWLFQRIKNIPPSNYMLTIKFNQ